MSDGPESDHWSIRFFVRNFNNEIIPANARQNGNVNINEYEFAAPRSYGAKLTVRW